MMNRFPFAGYPYRYYNYYQKYASNNPSLKSTNIPHNTNQAEHKTSFENMTKYNLDEKKSSKYSPFTFNLDGFTTNDEAIITLFGIKLFLDDLIIIGLIYLLYQEGVKDEMLFISLLLLLIS